MRRVRAKFPSLVAILLLTSVGFAQTPRPTATTIADDTVELNSDLVLVSAVVTKFDNTEKLIRNLKPTDFQILDDGVPQQIEFFGDENLALDVVFLVDASDSIKFREKFQREALGAFLRTVVRPVDRAAVFWFNESLHVEQDFTSQPGLLLSAIERIPNGGATALYSALTVAADRVATRSGRRTIVILSDGRDTFSTVRLDQALRKVQSVDAVIYAINTSYAGWAVTNEFRKNDPLEFLAAETGGEVFYSATEDDIEKTLSLLAGRLRERYVLGFYPSGRSDGKFHRLTVTVTRKGSRIFARSGYYAR